MTGHRTAAPSFELVMSGRSHHGPLGARSWKIAGTRLILTNLVTDRRGWQIIAYGQPEQCWLQDNHLRRRPYRTRRDAVRAVMAAHAASPMPDLTDSDGAGPRLRPVAAGRWATADGRWEAFLKAPGCWTVSRSGGGPFDTNLCGSIRETQMHIDARHADDPALQDHRAAGTSTACHATPSHTAAV